MKVKLKKEWGNGRLKPVLEDIKARSKINAEGRVSWSDFSIEIFISIAQEAYEIPDGVPARVVQAKIRRAILNRRAKSCTRDAELTREINKLVDDWLNLPLSNFALLSEVTFKIDEPHKSLRFRAGETSIEISRSFPVYMAGEHLSDRHRQPYGEPSLGRMPYLISRLKARDQIEAVEVGLGANALFLGLANLASKKWNLLGAENRPEALLKEGPYHFVFKNRKYEDGSWYNPDYRPEYFRLYGNDYQELFRQKENVSRAWVLLNNHPLKEALSNTLLMMNEGMNCYDVSERNRFYWTALERLFSEKDEAASYDRIIKRAIFLENDKREAKLVLKHLVRLRNEKVHWGRGANNQNQVSQYCADLVRRFVFYIIFNCDDFNSHSEFLELADLPGDRGALERRRIAIERRLNFMENNRHKR